jgi:hypothetical protein
MYFSIQRIIAFLVGVFLISLAVISWFNSTNSIGLLLAAFGLGGFGLYVVVASLVPYKNPTEEIANEVLGKIFIEIPIRFVLNLLGKVNDVV